MGPCAINGLANAPQLEKEPDEMKSTAQGTFGLLEGFIDFRDYCWN